MLPYEIDYRALPFPKLALCTNKRQFQRLMRTINITPHPEWLVPGFPATTHIIDGKKEDDTRCVVCIDAGDRDPVTVAGMLVHEAVHVMQELRRNMNETQFSTETEAYLIQGISGALMHTYRAMRLRKEADT